LVIFSREESEVFIDEALHNQLNSY